MAFILLYILVFVVRLPRVFFVGQTVLLFQAIVYGVLAVGGVDVLRKGTESLMHENRQERQRAQSKRVGL